VSRSIANPPSPDETLQGKRPIARSERRNVIDLFAKDGATKHKAAPPKANPIDAHVGGRLRMKRLACGLSQQKLAAAAGVSVAQLQRLESGAMRIDAHLFRDLTQILKAPPSYFFTGFLEKPATPPSE
jgi:ribosome-binding protein aMBF1 (putative translation factor)